MATLDVSKMNKRITDASGKVISEEKGKKDQAEEGRYYWWKASDEEIAKQIQGTIKLISTHQSTRLEQLTSSTRLYGNSSAFNFIGPGLSRSASASGNSQSNRISFNVCSSVVDTLVSKIAKNKVIPTFITAGGVWGMQHKAEQLSKFTEGMFYGQDIHSKGVFAFRDAGVWGTGIVHIYEDEDEIKVDRALPHEFFVDQVEGLASDPRQLHRVKIMDRDIMVAFIESLTDEECPDKEKALEAVAKDNPASFIDLGGIGTAADLIVATFSWHLKSSKKAKDGCYAICVNDVPVYRKQYDKDYYPFAFFHYNKRLMGFWGQSACERLQNLQAEINRLMILDQKSRWMMSSFKILIENGSKVVSQHLNNDIGTIVNYTGTEPKYVTPPPIHPSNEQKLDSLIAKSFQQEGVSQLSASSLKPVGIDSGKALRTFDQIAEDRFLFVGQEMEKFYLEIARQMIEVAKDIYKRKKSFKVTFPQETFVESIDWADIRLKTDEYVLKAYPTSSLSTDLTGKLQEVQELMQAGIISPRAGRRLLAMPDVEMSDKLANAAENLLHKIYEEILNDLKYTSPEPQFDLQLAGSLYLEYYNYATLNNAPEENMEMLKKFKAQLDSLTGVAAQAVQGQQAIQTLQAQQANQQTMANPTPTPTSPLIQNTNNQIPA